MLILTESPLINIKSLKFTTENLFDEAFDILKHTSISELNIFYHNLDKLWSSFQSHFVCLDAAGGLVKNNENKTLFIYRLGKWDLPKGKVEIGETTEFAAVREVEEECGIKNLKLNQLITKTYHIYYQKTLILKTTYWYDMNYHGNEILVPQIEEGISMVEWKSNAELTEILDNTYKNIKLVLQLSNQLNEKI